MKASTRRHLTGYGFVLPWLIALAVFIGWPFVAGFYFSFCDYPPLQTPLFIGLDNYRELLNDPVFHRSLGVTFIYAAVAIPLGVLVALTLALMLNARIRGQSFYRVIFFLPHLVPTVVVALLWLWLFNPDYGLINLILGRVMALADHAVALFFHVEPGTAPTVRLTPRAAVLLLPFAALFVRKLPFLKREMETAPRVAKTADVITIVLCLAAGAIILYTGACHFLPTDVRKLHSPGWLSDGSPFPSGIPFAPSWALWAIIIMSMWGVGQMAVIYLAKLQDVPVQLYEAADIDGATWLQKTRFITIPLISPVILFNVVMAIIGTFQVFTEPYIMTRGGPEDKTRFIAMFIYDQAFQYQRVGYASAVAWVLFLVIVGLTLLAFRISRGHVYYEGR